MEFVIWGGAALSLLGVIGLVGCIVLAVKARRSALSEDDMRARLQKVVVLNMAALAVSAIGLMAVIVGIILS
jgi:hypothetical protein